jgi:hypothetical protein
LVTVAKKWPKSGQKVAKKWPKSGRKVAEKWPKSSRKKAKSWKTPLTSSVQGKSTVANRRLPATIVRAIPMESRQVRRFVGSAIPGSLARSGGAGKTAGNGRKSFFAPAPDLSGSLG